MFTGLRNIFSRSTSRSNYVGQVIERLAIEGVNPVPLTPVADASELAAAALLESIVIRKKSTTRKVRGSQSAGTPEGTPAYYHAISQKIREAQAAEVRSALRYISYTEQCLQTDASSEYHGGSLAELESGIYKHQNAAERIGGELLCRWQHVLATITIRQMEKYSITVNDNTIRY